MGQKNPENKSALHMSLGIATRDGSYIKLIGRNTLIPTKMSRILTTIKDNQTSITLHIRQGEHDNPDKNITLGKINLNNIPLAPKGVPRIEVAFNIDAEGVLDVSARDLGTSKQVNQIVIGQVQTKQPQIKNVRLFIKQSAEQLDSQTFTFTSLPEGSIKDADQKLGLDGELIDWFKERDISFPEDISNVEDANIESFFSKQSQSEIWDAYHVVGSRSGNCYYLLVDFHVQPSVPLDTIEARREVYMEYKELLGELSSQYALEHPTTQPGVIPNYIMTIADRRIRCKYGISELDMVGIHGEAITSFWSIDS